MSDKPTSRRNFACFLIDAAGWPLGQSFLSSETILPMFVARLSGLHLLIGAMVAIQSLGNLLPQLAAANIVERLPITKRYVVILGIVGERVPIIILALAVFLVPHPGHLLVVFFVCWAVVNASTGFNMPAFLSLFAKSTGIRARGRIAGIGNGAGTLLAVGGAYVARLLLESLPGLEAYGWCFLLGSVVLLASVVPLGFVDEPRHEAHTGGRSLKAYLRELPSLFRRQKSFRRFVLTQILLQAGFVSTSFITGYVVLELGESEGTVALCTAALMAATALGSLGFGFLGDAKGYRVVYLLGATCGLAAYSVMAASPQMPLVYLVFGLSGLFRSALAVGSNMVIEFSEPSRAATFTAVMFTATAPFRVLFPLLAGVAADAVGLSVVFLLVAISLVFVLAVFSFAFTDPRYPRRL